MALFKRRPKPEKIAEQGQRETGRIVGILVRNETDSNDQKEQVELYAVALSIGTLAVGQQLLPLEGVRLGMEVVAIHHEGIAVIDWAATCGGEAPYYRWYTPKKVPPSGITDERLKLDRARRQTSAVATIRKAEARDAFMGASKALALDVTVEGDGIDAYDTELAKVKVPFYASHLVEVGTRLPVWVKPGRLDKVTVDWPAAAEAEPGVGRPPSAVLAEVRTLFGGAHAATSGTGGSGLGGGMGMGGGGMGMGGGTEVGPADTSQYPPLEGLDFDTWIEVQAGLAHDRIPPAGYDEYAQQHGVAPGTWASADAAWHKLLRSGDWRLGMAYGEAMEAAQKRR